MIGRGGEEDERLELRDGAPWAALLVLFSLAPLVVVWVGTPWLQLPWTAWEAAPAGREEYYRFFGGTFNHTMILLMGGTVALCGALLSMVHTLIRGSSLTSLIGLVLFWSGSVDLVLAVSAEGMIWIAEDVEDFVPFTWLVTRSFFTVLLTVGGLLLLSERARRVLHKPAVLLACFLVLGALALAVVLLTAKFELPVTVFPTRWIKRPMDIPFTLILVVGLLWIFPGVHGHFRSRFSLVLWLSLFPLVMAQLYLIFGSRYLFDDLFNWAYLLQALAFAVIFAGLLWDYAWRARREARRQEEERALERRLIQMDRMVTIGSVAVGVGHEIANPLSYVDTNIVWALESLEDSQESVKEVREALEAAHSGVEQVGEILKDLRTMSGLRAVNPGRVDLTAAAEMALRMTSAKLRGVAEVRSELQPHLWVRADETRITQVITNLLVNAWHAVRDEEGRQGVEVRAFAAGGKGVVEVRDTGPGIDEEVQARIFEPFFTTKPPGEGSGLGLSLSRRILEGFGGTLEFETAPGVVTTFRVEVPLWEGEEAEEEE